MSVQDGTEYRVVWYVGGARRVIIKQTRHAADDLVFWLRQNRSMSVQPWIEEREVGPWSRST
jgi:hypothetical protein